MTITIQCPQCGTQYHNIPEKYLGKSTQCKKCGMKFHAQAAAIGAPQTMEVVCPQCGLKRSNISTQYVGKTAKCKQCGASFRIETGSSVAITRLRDETTLVTKEIQAQPAIPTTLAETSAQTIAQTLYETGEARIEAQVRQQTQAHIPSEWDIGDIILDLYEVTGVLGHGGMGKVYKVHHRNWGIDLAVKSPLPRLFSSKNAIENFVREAETWVNLGLHPNAVSCYYVRTIDDIPRVFAECIEGGSLSDWIRGNTPPFPPRGGIQGGVLPQGGNVPKLYEGTPEEILERILDIALQFAWGLHFAHEKGLIHQDVKPANVMMTPDGTAKVTDFGLANARASAGEAPEEGQHGHTLLVPGSGLCTVEYASPEQLAGKPLTRRTDIWSWGISILEMFLGELIWKSGAVAGLSFDTYLEMGKEMFKTSMPKSLADLLRQCFQENPDDRPGTMQDVASALKEIYQHSTGQSYDRPEPKTAELLADSLNNRAVSFWDLGKKSEAFSVWDEALTLDNCHPESLYNKTLCEWREAQISDLEAVQRIEAVTHTHPQLHLYAGYLHLERAAADKAEEELRQAVREPGITNDSAAWQVLGDACMAQEKYTEAEEAYQTSLKIAPQQPETLKKLEFSQTHTRMHNGRVIFPWLRFLEYLSEPKEDRQISTWLAITPDGRYAVASREYRSKKNYLQVTKKTIEIWNPVTGERVREFGDVTSYVYALGIAGDRYVGFSRNKEKMLFLWDLMTGETLFEFQAPLKPVDDDTSMIAQNFMQPATKMVITPDGKFVVIYDAAFVDRSLRIWNLQTGGEKALGVDEFAATALAATSDSRFVITAEAFWNRLKVWNLLKSESIQVFKGHKGSIETVTATPDGRYVISGSEDKTVRLWNCATGTCERIFYGHKGSVKTLAVSPDGCYIISGSDDHTLRIWNLRTGQCVRTIEKQAPLQMRVAVTADGKFLIVKNELVISRWTFEPGTQDFRAAIQVCHQKNVAEVQTLNERFRKQVEHAKRALESGNVTAAYRHLRQARSIPGYQRHSEALTLNVALGKNLTRKRIQDRWLLRTFEGHTALMTVFDSNGQIAVSGSEDKTLKVWELATGKCTRTFKKHTGHITAVALTPDGRHVLSASGEFNPALNMWHVEQDQWSPFLEGHQKEITAIAVAPDGQYVLSGSKDNTMRLWKPGRGKCFQIFYGHKEAVTAVAILPDGECAVSATEHSDKTLRLWNLQTGKLIRKFQGNSPNVSTIIKEHTQSITDIAVTPDGQFVISASRDETLRLWNVSTGKCERIFRGHKGAVTTVVVTPEGHYAISGGEDTTLHVWNLKTGELIQTLEGHSAGLKKVTLSPNARFLTVLEQNAHTLKLWELDWEWNHS